MEETQIQFLTRFIVESDAIENIQANSELVQSQLRNGEQKGHVGALVLMDSLAQEKKQFLTEDLVCRIQGLITAEQHTKPGGPKLKPEWIGKYRLVNLSIKGRIAPHPTLIPSLMRSWVIRTVAWQRSCSDLFAANLTEIADLHYEYERVHPFVDGNGRSGRALVYYLLCYCGITPFVFTSGDKYKTYYRCFDNREAMRRYFASRTGL